MSNENDWVLDPFLGVGTTIIAAVRHGRRGAGAETMQEYVDITRDRIIQELNGTLRTRPMNKPVYDPEEAGHSLRTPPWKPELEPKQLKLCEKKPRKYGAK